MTSEDQAREQVTGLCAKLAAFRSGLTPEEQRLLDGVIQRAGVQHAPEEVEGFARKAMIPFADAYKAAVQNTKVTPVETQMPLAIRG